MGNNKDNLKVVDEINAENEHVSRKKSTVDNSEKKERWKESTVENENNKNAESIMSEVINKINSDELIDKYTELNNNEAERKVHREKVEQERIDNITKSITRFVPIILGLFIAIIFSTIYSNHLKVKDIENTKELCRLLNEMRDMGEIDSKIERKVYKLVKAGYWDKIRLLDSFYGYSESIYHYTVYLEDTDLLEMFLNDKHWEESIESYCAGTPLQYATIYENVEAVKLLLEHGANPLYTTNAKSEAYALALMTNNEELIKEFTSYVEKSSYAAELKRIYDKNGYISVVNTDENLTEPLYKYQYSY